MEIRVRNLPLSARVPNFAGTPQTFFESKFRPGVSQETAMSRAHSSLLQPPLSQRKRRSALFFQMDCQVCPVQHLCSCSASKGIGCDKGVTGEPYLSAADLEC